MGIETWAQVAENRENFEFFSKNFLLRDKSPLSDFYKIRRGGVSQVRSLMPNYTVVTLKMCAYRRRSRQNWYFLYKCAPNGYIPLCDFYKILHAEGTTRPAPSCQI